MYRYNHSFILFRLKLNHIQRLTLVIGQEKRPHTALLCQGKNQLECISLVQVIPEQPFHANEAKPFVKMQCRFIRAFRFEHDLVAMHFILQSVKCFADQLLCNALTPVLFLYHQHPDVASQTGTAPMWLTLADDAANGLARAMFLSWILCVVSNKAKFRPLV